MPNLIYPQPIGLDPYRIPASYPLGGDSLYRGLVAGYIAAQSFGADTWSDITGNQNDGALTNGPTWVPSDRPGGFGALDFDGTDDYVSVSNDFTPTTGARTICSWVRITDLTVIAHIAGVRETPGAPDRGWDFRVRGDLAGDPLSYAHYGVAGVTSNSNPLTANSWSHACATWNGSTVAFYVDGISFGGGNLSSPNQASSNLYIGARNNDGVSDGFFPGLIDDVRIYNRSLSAFEVRQLYLDSLRGYPRLLNYLSPQFFSPAPVPSGFPFQYYYDQQRAL